MTRTVILTQDEAGWWIATCPSLPGCVSQGETRAEALANIAEAIWLYIEVLEEDGEPIPPFQTRRHAAISAIG